MVEWRKPIQKVGVGLLATANPTIPWFANGTSHFRSRVLDSVPYADSYYLLPLVS